MPITAYTFNIDDDTRQVVAAPSRRQAAILLGLTAKQFAEHVRISTSETDINQAMLDPGAVWVFNSLAGEWAQLKTSRKARMLPQHGGSRSGAGAPLVGPLPTRNRTVRLDDNDWNDLSSCGGPRFIRRMMRAGLKLTEDDIDAIVAAGGLEWLRLQISKAKKKPRAK